MLFTRYMIFNVFSSVMCYSSNMYNLLHNVFHGLCISLLINDIFGMHAIIAEFQNLKDSQHS